MKKKVILYHPRTFHEQNYRNFWLPFSIISVASPLPYDGFEPIIIDNNLECKADYTDELTKLLNDAVCVGVSAMIGHQIKEGLEFSKTVRQIKREIPIVWGGPMPTILPHLAIESEYIDIIVQGQGEITFRELVNLLVRNESIANVKGISYKINGEVKTTDKRKIMDKNSFPPYDFRLVDTQKYVRSDEHINTRVLNYISSVGCPYNCGFCSEVKLYNRRWTALRAERILDEIELLVKDNNLNGVKFYDANFFVDRKRVIKFAQGLIDREIHIKWAASAHPSPLLKMSDEEMRILARSGLSRLLIGAESGNPDELKFIDKHITTEDVIDVAKKCSKYNIHGSFTVIVGYPGFPKDYIRNTLRFGEMLREIDHRHEVKAHIFTPYPGTPLFMESITQGFNPPKTIDDWSTYDYYEIETPWVDNQDIKIIREFNERNCPYVL